MSSYNLSQDDVDALCRSMGKEMTTHWYLFTIRSWFRSDLEEHRDSLMRMCWACGPIYTSRSHVEDMLPAGMHFFACYKRKSDVSQDEMDFMCAWSDRWGQWHPTIPKQTPSIERKPMIPEPKLKQMRECSHLLPDPGGEIVRECLDEIDRLRAALRSDEPEDLAPNRVLPPVRSVVPLTKPTTDERIAKLEKDAQELKKRVDDLSDRAHYH